MLHLSSFCIGHLRFDVTPFYLCCSGFFKACNRYYSKRPNDNCMDWPDRTSIGTIKIGFLKLLKNRAKDHGL